MANEAMQGAVGARSRGGTLIRSAFVLAATVLSAGCNDLLTVPSSPHEVSTEDPVTLQSLMTGLKADFYYAYDSYLANVSQFTDIFYSPSFDPGHLQPDRRDVDEGDARGVVRDQSPYSGFWHPQQKSNFTATRAQGLFLEGGYPQIGEPPEESAAYAEASLYAGFAKLWFAEAWCSAAFNGEGPEYTSQQVYELAAVEFTKAIEADRATEEVRQAALAGRARARLNFGDRQGALQDASRVEPGLEFQTHYSTNTFEQRNRVWWHTWGFSNNSVDFRVWGNLTVDDSGVPDPRVDLAQEPHPSYDPAWPLWAPNKVADPSSPLTVTSYDEAQLIIAEVALGQTAVDIINSTRQRHGIDVTWTPVTGTDAEILAKVIDERGRTLFLEGSRVGDLRRYQRDYGIDLWQDETVQGVPMLERYCYPLPDSERLNNPGLSGG